MISVIVLGLKSDSYLTRCLNSLKRQVFKDFEVVLVSSSEYESDVEYGYSEFLCYEISSFKPADGSLI